MKGLIVNNITTCINCACPSNFSGDCCGIEPGNACDSNPCAIPNYQCINYPGGQYQCVCGVGYYGENCSEVYCNPGDGSSIYVDASANGHVTPTHASYQPIANAIISITTAIQNMP
uniref:EGF-like domain-containing protein n=1 Tax=Acrobeloides nanus TaxID=290746 RepID=A0A914ESD9_9BILA